MVGAVTWSRCPLTSAPARYRPLGRRGRPEGRGLERRRGVGPGWEAGAARRARRVWAAAGDKPLSSSSARMPSNNPTRPKPGNETAYLRGGRG
ncbi:MAG: hypothetical protein WKG07_13455 [Hymenobacter sp.]